jgi:hypothetical protein
MSFTAHLQHECSPLAMVGARHRTAFVWCAMTTTSTVPNTKRQRLKEPSPG